MYGHEVVKDGKTYKIGLFERRYFRRTKLADVVLDVPELEDAKKLCGMLDNSFKAGMIMAKQGEKNA